MTTSSFATVARGAPPEAQKITPQLIEAAKKEGKVTWYTSVDLPVAEKVAKAFEAAYPGISMKVERSGAERIFQRIGQEYSSRIYVCDVVNSSDAAHLIIWKRGDLLAPYLPEDVIKHFPKEHWDADGMYASWRLTLSPIAYNTNLVKPEEAPKGFLDLLDPKWSGKIVKAHPGYSGTIMTATQQLAAILAGTISRSSPSRRSCKCSRPPIRPRSWRWASVPSWLTGPNTFCFSSRRRASRWRSCIRPRVRPSSSAPPR